mmetsp:Transcript_21708/g.55062  ORF Transcript_21708/g.55062 Transcript_21708/m.55062 type:complete len:215 (+) Transcript_21708:135-779(+)
MFGKGLQHACCSEQISKAHPSLTATDLVTLPCDEWLCEGNAKHASAGQGCRKAYCNRDACLIHEVSGEVWGRRIAHETSCGTRQESPQAQDGQRPLECCRHRDASRTAQAVDRRLRTTLSTLASKGRRCLEALLGLPIPAETKNCANLLDDAAARIAGSKPWPLSLVRWTDATSRKTRQPLPQPLAERAAEKETILEWNDPTSNQRHGHRSCGR